MAKVGGLGLDEKSIGLIGTISGVVFVACQYFIFSVSMKHFGLHKTMLMSSLLCVSPAIFLPLSLWISNTTTVLLYTGVMNGITSLFFSNWNAALSITQNRAVHPQSRSRVNGLAAIGTAMARGFGPLVGTYGNHTHTHTHTCFHHLNYLLSVVLNYYNNILLLFVLRSGCPRHSILFGWDRTK